MTKCAPLSYFIVTSLLIAQLGKKCRFSQIAVTFYSTTEIMQHLNWSVGTDFKNCMYFKHPLLSVSVKQCSAFFFFFSLQIKLSSALYF